MKRRIIMGVLGCVGGLLVLTFLWKGMNLHNHGIALVDDQGKTLAQYELDASMTFTLSSYHSVSGTQVKEVYRVIEDGFILAKMIYEDQGGAGLPDVVLEGNFYREGEWMIIDNLDRQCGSLEFWVQRPYENQLTIKDQVYDLWTMSDDESFLLVLQPY